MKIILLSLLLVISGCSTMPMTSEQKNAYAVKICDAKGWGSTSCSEAQAGPATSVSGYSDSELIYQIMPSGNLRPVYKITK
jgi:hypothetical protein